MAKNKAASKSLEAQKACIEADFGDELDWQELPDGEGCRIRYVIDGGYRSPPEEWPTIHAALSDAMVRLDYAGPSCQPDLLTVAKTVAATYAVQIKYIECSGSE